MQPGLSGRNFALVLAVAGAFAFADPFVRQCGAADLSLPVTGAVVGSVVDATGTPQMGATIQLLNKYQRILAKTVSAADGRFAFTGIPVDVYSVRVSLASFLPVSRDKIAVKAGTGSVLQIHLASLFSSIELTYTVPVGGMTDDWKWVLRSSPATRPINRIFAGNVPPPAGPKLHPKIFSDTRAMLSVSGGAGGFLDADSSLTDLGTGFALTTNFLGKNQLQLAGNFGSSGMETGPSTMSLCAIYTPGPRDSLVPAPEVTFTMAQFGRFGTEPSSSDVAVPQLASVFPALRTMSLSFYNTADLLDNVHLEYGMTGESVEFLQHSSRISPFARITANLGSGGEFLASYSDGGRPDELTAHQEDRQSLADSGAADLGGNALEAMSRLPQMSERNGQLELERAQDYEIGYKKVVRSRTYAVSAFYEDVSNGHINVAGDLSALPASDLLSDGMSLTSTYNIGHYHRTGYVTSVNQRITDTFHVAVAYGRMGGFSAIPGALGEAIDSPRAFLDERDRNVASANVRWRVPLTGLQFLASYGWTDAGTFIPRHAFTTQSTDIAPGFNISIRQPIPAPFGMPGHFELTADLRNLLAQGYVPLAASDGGQMLIVQAPRALRGGLNFVF